MVCVLDNFDGCGYVLVLVFKCLLNVIGVWDSVVVDIQFMFDIKVSDGCVGEGFLLFFLYFDYNEIEEGLMGFMCEDCFFYCVFQVVLLKVDGIIQINEDLVVD